MQEHREDQPHQARADHLGIGPAQRHPRRRTPDGQVEDHPDQEAERQERKSHRDRPSVQPLGLLQARQREPEPGTPLMFEPIGLDQVHQAGGKRHARADRPGQEENAVHRAPEPSGPPPLVPLRRPRREPTRQQHQGQHQRKHEQADRHLTGRADHQVQADQGQDPRQHQQRLEDRRHRHLVLRPAQVRQVRRLHQPAQRRQPDGQVPAGRAAGHEPGQLAQERQAIRARKTKDLQPQHDVVPRSDPPHCSVSAWRIPETGRAAIQ